MTAGDENLLRNVTREMLAELLPGLLEEALAGPREGNGNGHSTWHTTAPVGGATSIEQDIPHDPPAGVVPQVPAPPIAAVHRPPGWRAPERPAAQPAAGEPRVPGTLGSPGAEVEQVTIRSDADLDAFVRQLARRLENPKDRMDIVSGRVRFSLAGGGASQAPGAGPELRIEKGAVTERHVREAAEKGARIVLARRAVLTPMARDRARTLGVDIEKERRC
ncbi:MAG TPA: hypothetical protein VFH74_13100 [Gaiellales bacterium]|nr:hypothetical protein [Gaiellales bacterium]